MAPVSGKVTLDGQPLANVNVVFQPTADKAGIVPGPGSMGTTDAQGQYTLRLMADSPRPGAVVGHHMVHFAVVVQQPKAGQEIPTANPLASKIPATALEFDVPAGGSNQANFDLKSTAAPGTPAGRRGGQSSS